MWVLLARPDCYSTFNASSFKLQASTTEYRVATMLSLNTLVLNLGAITFLWNIVAIKMSKFRKTSFKLPAPYI
jgi:hypothetical protein